MPKKAKATLFKIPANMVNDCEKQYKLDLTPLGIRKIINKKISECGQKGLEMKCNEATFKLWANTEGHSYNEDAPIMESETYLPFVEDPLVALEAVLNRRHEWDMEKNQKHEFIDKYTSAQHRVKRLLTKRTIVGPRE